MLRILKFTTNRSLGAPETFKAIQAAQDVVEAAKKLPGVNSCSLHLGTGALVITAESESYAVADRALADAGIQATVGRLGQEFGYSVASDEFLLDPSQVYPFINTEAYAVAR